MFGVPGPSHEWDTLAFALSTIPCFAALLLIAGSLWERLIRADYYHRERRVHHAKEGARRVAL